jgi:protein-S-isoprenylcysteine O-methyltransferase Ste14
MTTSRWSWWGERGEWYVALQAALLVLVLVGPWISGAATRPGAAMRAIGFLLIACGLLLGLTAISYLRRRDHRPPSTAPLVTSGPYRFIRHPMYAGLDLVALGWALSFGGWLTSLCCAAHRVAGPKGGARRTDPSSPFRCVRHLLRAYPAASPVHLLSSVF